MKPTMAIFIHDPQCETECALGMIEGLVSEYNIRTFGLDELHIRFLVDFDVVAFPGGMGDSDDFYSIFSPKHISAVQQFVQFGGKYFGICMGAYWAGPMYFDLVTDLEVEQYIAQPDCEITTDGPTVAQVYFDSSEETMYFYDGCAILGDNLQVFARYENHNAMAAIQGNVGLFGCHPEALAWWYTEGDMPADYYTWHHAQLMREFVAELLAQ